MNETSDTQPSLPDDQPGECLREISAHISKSYVALHHGGVLTLATSA